MTVLLGLTKADEQKYRQKYRQFVLLGEPLSKREEAGKRNILIFPDVTCFDKSPHKLNFPPPHSHSIVSELCKTLKALRLDVRQFARAVSGTVRNLRC